VTLKFVDLDTVVGIHRLQLSRYGGSSGIRDLNLLDSALAQPKATFGGEFLHKDVFEMASAYLFHIVMNHPFVDGNKRTGLLVAMTFLALNGYIVRPSKSKLFDMTIKVAQGEIGKEEVTKVLRALAKPR
jgi:death on curing protein